MAAPVLRPLGTGEVLDVSFGLYRALFFPLVVVAAVSRAAPLLLSIFLQPATTRDPMANLNALVDRWPLWFALIALSMVAAAFAVAATTSLVSAEYLGHAITPNTALAKATSVIGRLIVVSILTSLSVGLGLIFLIVPGIILLSGLAISAVALVLEPGLGPIEAMSRSWTLTSGFRGKVFVTLFVAYLFLLIPSFVVGLVSAIASIGATWPPAVTVLSTGLLQVVVYPFLYVVITVLYYDLRVRKEGYDLELLAATATHPVA